MEIGENIKLIRKEKGYTQKQLAEKLGTSPQNFAQYENGKRKPKFETLKKIADALGVPAGDLIESICIGPMFEDDISALEYLQENYSECPLENESEIKTEKFLLDNYRKLNDTGKIEAVKRVQELTEIPKYTTPDQPPTPDN